MDVYSSLRRGDATRIESPILHKFEANGNFVVSRTKNDFSSMGLDQRHEQLKKDVEGDDGMVGLTEDEDKLRQ